MLQAQKLLKLEEVDVKVEEDPKGEIIVELSGEALRHPGKDFTKVNVLSVWVCLGSSPISGFLLEAVWLLGETFEEEEGEAEEPETSTQE